MYIFQNAFVSKSLKYANKGNGRHTKLLDAHGQCKLRVIWGVKKLRTIKYFFTNLSFQSYIGSTKTINYAHHCSTNLQNNPQEYVQKFSNAWFEITSNYWMWNISPHTYWPSWLLHACNWITRSYKCYSAASNNHVRQIVILIILQANCGIFVVFPPN